VVNNLTIQVFNSALAFTLKWEGGESNDPADLGGRTDHGITQATYNTYRKAHGKPPQTVFNITDDEVRSIYQLMFWSPSYAYLCDLPLAATLFDTSVNFNPPTFRDFVSSALLVKKPGIIDTVRMHLLGPSVFMSGEMVNALKVLTPSEQQDVALGIVACRKAYRYQRVRQNSSQRKFLQGWLRRDCDLESLVKAKE
jgi:lysozyme family protein